MGSHPRHPCSFIICRRAADLCVVVPGEPSLQPLFLPCPDARHRSCQIFRGFAFFFPHAALCGASFLSYRASCRPFRRVVRVVFLGELSLQPASLPCPVARHRSGRSARGLSRSACALSAPPSAHPGAAWCWPPPPLFLQPKPGPAGACWQGPSGQGLLIFSNAWGSSWVLLLCVRINPACRGELRLDFRVEGGNRGAVG